MSGTGCDVTGRDGLNMAVAYTSGLKKIAAISGCRDVCVLPLIRSLNNGVGGVSNLVYCHLSSPW